MKLLFCRACGDIRKLFTGVLTQCYCKKSSGAYEKDGLHAWYVGPCEMLGIANNSFGEALQTHRVYPQTIPGGPGYRFDTFFIPEVAPTVERKA